MRISILLSIIILFFLNTSVFGQEKLDTQVETKKHSLGIAAGSTIGYGLAYRYMPKRFGVQITTHIIPNGWYNNNSVTFLYQLRKRKYSKFFLYQSNLYSNYWGYGFMMMSAPSFHWNNGLGFGVELFLGKHLGLNLMGGIGCYDSFKEITLTAESGLFYKF